MNRFLNLGRLILAVVAAGVLAGCSETSETEETPPPEIRPVRYLRVYSTGGDRVRSFSGAARASMESILSFRVPGRLQRIAVKVGDNVRAGQLIAELDSKDYNLQMQEAEAALEQAQAQARNAASNYERVRALYENRNASRNDLDAARAADESAKAAIESVSKKLELAQSQLSYTKLTAPVEGAIATVDRDVNENIKAGDRVAMLTSGSRLEVEVGVPEILISQVREGQMVTVTFDAVPNEHFQARVTEVGVATSDRASTFPVTVLLSRENANIRAGMAAQVGFSFAAEGGRERFVVPPVAVGEDREGRFVYTVEPAKDDLGTVHRKTVTTGELSDEGLDVLSGLTDGDLLVTAGISRIEDGMTVKLLTAHEEQP